MIVFNTFNPLALLMARRGLSTLSTLRIFTTEIALDLHKDMTKSSLDIHPWGN